MTSDRKEIHAPPAMEYHIHTEVQFPQRYIVLIYFLSGLIACLFLVTIAKISNIRDDLEDIKGQIAAVHADVKSRPVECKVIYKQIQETNPIEIIETKPEADLATDSRNT